MQEGVRLPDEMVVEAAARGIGEAVDPERESDEEEANRGRIGALEGASRARSDPVRGRPSANRV